jgi:hypothetical protein
MERIPMVIFGEIHMNTSCVRVKIKLQVELTS